jgi:hypothetical protein
MRKVENRIRNVYTPLLDDGNAHTVAEFVEANGGSTPGTVKWEIGQLRKCGAIVENNEHFSYADADSFVSVAIEHFENYRKGKTTSSEKSENVFVKKAAAKRSERQDIENDPFFDTDESIVESDVKKN